MSTETCTPPGDTSDEEWGGQIYDLDESRWSTLSDEAKVALAIAELAVEHESFESASDLTEAIADMTLLDKKARRKANSSLLQDDCLERLGFGASGAVRLELSEKGHEFVEDSIIKVQWRHLLYWILTDETPQAKHSDW